ncbi:MAG: MFS transporter, partial [archaeon GB-1867-097]|nr:MFS transporter [Candidatus Culexmicrobium thermophilum]
AGLLSTYPASWLSDKIGRKIIVVLAMIPARFSVIVVPFARDYFTLMLIFLVRAASFNVSMPVMRALQADIAPRSIRGRVFGLQEALSNLGFFFGPLIGSYLYYVLKGSVILGFPGIVIPFLISGVISFLTLILFAIFVREPISIAP